MLVPFIQPAPSQAPKLANTPTSMTDEEIVQEIVLNGRTELFGIIYSRYSQKVYRKCVSFTKDLDAAKDLAQDVLVKVFSQLHKFSGRSKFSTWLYAITYNFCVESYRKNSKYRLQELDETHDHEEEVEDLGPLMSRSRHLQKALNEIADEDRDILLMKYQQDLSIKELTARFNISDSAVKMRLARARQRVKEIIRQSERQAA